MNTITKMFLYLLVLTQLIGFISCNQKSSEEYKQSNKFHKIARNITSKNKHLLTDIDGNIYKTIKIGRQTWMAENLKATTFNDSEPIPNVTDDLKWYKRKSPAFCWYNNDSTIFGKEYGVLYNYHAINTEKLCPSGWHIPTGKEFQVLVSTIDPGANYLRHEVSYTTGGKLKETGNSHWQVPNTEANNESGFTALPGGCRSYNGMYSMINSFGYYGSSTDEFYLAFRNSTGSVFMRNKVSKYVGVSVRCIKDQ